MTILIDKTSRTTKASLLHVSKVEAAVNRLAPVLWSRTSSLLLRWVHRVLKRLKPTLSNIVIERRVIDYDPEVVFLASLIAGFSLEESTPILATALGDFGEQVALQYGWLPSDPRFAVIESYSQSILEDDLSAFWRSLTEPEALAKKLVDLCREGLSYTEMARQIDGTYRSGFYRAERLVRSSWNSAANYSHHQDLLEQGYTHKRFITARDARVRAGGKSKANHRAMDGVTVPIDQPFVMPSGARLMFPGDRSLGAPVSELANCRCVVVGIAVK